MKDDIQLAIGDENGNVVLQLSQSTNEVKIKPENAKLIGEEMARRAYYIQTGKYAPEGKSVIADAVREKLIIRTVHIMRNLQGKKKPLDYIAMQLVDTVLAEVS